MSKKSTPALVKIVAGVVVGLIGWKVFFSSDEEASPAQVSSGASGQGQQTVPAPANNGNKDTVNEEVAALAIQLQGTLSQLQTLQKQVEDSSKQSQKRLDEIDQGVSSQLVEVKKQLGSEVATLQEQVNSLAPNDPLSEYQVPYPGSSAGNTGAGPRQYQVNNTTVTQLPNAKPREFDDDGFLIVEPVNVTSEVQIPEDAKGGRGMLSGIDSFVDRGAGILARASTAGDNVSNGKVTEMGGQQANNPSIPMLTIPENTRVFDAVATSTILGRIPRGGSVQDPYEFQVELGHDALASGGHYVPGLARMRMRGVAIGDPALNCVSGSIYSMTFIFDDGAITQIGSGQGGNKNEPIAKILDQYGTECIAGKVVGNEGVNAAGMVAASAVKSIGDAYARSELESVAAGQSTATNVDNPNVYVASELFSGVGEQTAQLLANRYANVFNAIKVPLGTPLIVEFKRQVNIDYNPQRKIVHESYSELSSSGHGAGLFY